MAVKNNLPIAKMAKEAATPPDLLVRFVDQTLLLAFDHAVAAYRAKPQAGNNWNTLEDSMWAWQGWCQLTDQERTAAAAEVASIGIGHWSSYFATRHRNSL